jgi:hypothetical protein
MSLKSPLGPGRYRNAAAQRIRKAGIPCTPGTLANMASDGTGPIYRVISGRCYYLDADIDAWIATRISGPIRKASDVRRYEVAA